MLKSPMRKGRSGLRKAGKSALFPHGIQSSSAPVQKFTKKKKTSSSRKLRQGSLPISLYFHYSLCENKSYIWSTTLQVTRYWCQMARQRQLVFCRYFSHRKKKPTNSWSRMFRPWICIDRKTTRAEMWCDVLCSFWTCAFWTRALWNSLNVSFELFIWMIH